MDKKLAKAMQEQVNKELFSSYLYLGMVNFFEENSLGGFSHWMKMQAQEELLHGLKIFNYMHERGETVPLPAIAAAKTDYDSVDEIVKATLAHEKTVTASINALYSTARDVNDNAAMSFLQWFVDEQVEEEKNVNDILGKLKLTKSHPAGILFVDQGLASRPAPVVANILGAAE